MYLEISARQTGKTTRLVDSILQRSLNGEQCIVFGYNNSLLKHIQCSVSEKLNEYVSDKNFIFHVPKYFNSYEMYIKYLKNNDFEHQENHYFYYDDFDFYKDDIIISDKGYYVTTAKYTRTVNNHIIHVSGVEHDTLLELLNMNNNKVISYSTKVKTLDDSNRLNQMKKYYGDNRFDCEIRNIWNNY